MIFKGMRKRGGTRVLSKCVCTQKVKIIDYEPPICSFDTDPKNILTGRNTKAQIGAQNAKCTYMGGENKLVANIMQKPQVFVLSFLNFKIPTQGHIFIAF